MYISGSVGLNLEQHGAEQTRGDDGPEHAETYAGGGEDAAFTDHHAQNHALGRAERHAQADLASPLAHR